MTEATFIILDVGPSERRAVTTPRTVVEDVFYIHFATASGTEPRTP